MSWQAHGFRAWLVQRLSAAYIALCLLVVIICLFCSTSPPFETWQGLFASPAVNILVLLFFIAIMLHAWVGIRDVVMDYVHSALVRFITLILLMLFLMSMSVWIAYILFTLVKL
ncbi:succinate dehydrogenase, hydrophobic membrane anchor protein [Beggiatoa alba]|nr:succinate dehydrogenase, hydrophobic membrane anchor protein [Beggiatoa alba]